MIGRLDVARTGKCPSCFGSKKDRRKRKRPCPKCMGYGTVWMCQNCLIIMPCPGTNSNILDQSRCNLPRRSREGEYQMSRSCCPPKNLDND